MTPVIGITAYDDEASWRNWKARAAMLPYAYVDAVRQGGGRPVLLPPGEDKAEASATVAGLDGLVVSGGPDVDPVRYGQPRHPRTQPPVTLRDEWDLAVTGAALAQGVPLLAICRGMQVLNVCRGGTLHQHVPDLVGHERHEGTPGVYGQPRGGCFFGTACWPASCPSRATLRCPPTTTRPWTCSATGCGRSRGRRTG